LKTRIAIFGAALLSVCLSAAPPALSESAEDSDSESILEIRSKFNESIANHDSSRIADYLDSDYQITTGSGKHYRSTPKEEAEEWAEMFRDSPDIIYVRTPDDVEVSSHFMRASENGRWVGRWTSPDGDIEMGGRYFAHWSKVNGDWKIRAEVFVTLFCSGSGCT